MSLHEYLPQNKYLNLDISLSTCVTLYVGLYLLNRIIQFLLFFITKITKFFIIQYQLSVSGVIDEDASKGL